jgi:2-keto-4-pentenoate hydratase/2-oxohepta-3-ene-1,7-dioic acid hydratase in catechol pathway
MPIIPNKVVCAGFNYAEHIEEIIKATQAPMAVFIKSNSAISDTFYHFDDGYEFEGELSFIFANNKPIGVAFSIDITNRKLQHELMKDSLPWSLAKSFDNAAVFSQFIPLEGVDITALKMEFYRNGNLIQQGGYQQMINKPEDIVKKISGAMRMQDGDILMTGTPRGTTSYEVGDIFIGKIYSAEDLILEHQWQVKCR